MKQENIDVLHNTYPNVFGDEKIRPSVGDGWYSIVDDLCSVIEIAKSNLPAELQHYIYVTQIKEKFGTLRYYMNQSTPFIQGAITLAEYASEHTCEWCGAPGKLQLVNKWFKCLCDKHLEARLLQIASGQLLKFEP